LNLLSTGYAPLTHLGLLFFAIAAAVFYRRLEILDSFAKTLAST